MTAIADGACVASEPQGSPSWYPCNDNPRDKAAFDVVATGPAGVTAMGNGVLVGHTSARGRSTFRWRMAQPMATYLATLTVGRFDLTRAGALAAYRPSTPWTRGNPPRSACWPRCRRSWTTTARLGHFFDVWLRTPGRPADW